jgi:hypothetical protein
MVSLVISAGMVLGIQNVRPLMNISMAFMFAGLFFFGLVALRSRPMSRGNGLPALAGFWWPFLVIQAYVFPQLFQRLGTPGSTLVFFHHILTHEHQPGYPRLCAASRRASESHDRLR